MNVVTVNAGSSSLKLALFQMNEGSVARLGRAVVTDVSTAGAIPAHIIDELLPTGEKCDAVGHRVVQGGRFTEPQLITTEVRREISGAASLAPIHNAASLRGINSLRQRFPDVPHVAVFDTAFHAGLPAVASRYALPDEPALAGVRRFGYHGIAHRSLLERYAELTGAGVERTTIITLQLGSGCSIAAIEDGRSVETSMGYTPLEGLLMSTRSGDVDAAIVTYLQRAHGWSADDIESLLDQRSGLLGVSGRTGDMRELLRLEHAGYERSHRAVELFCYRARKYIGAYLAVVDARAIVFGGGIGENEPEIRHRICEPLRRLAIAIDRRRNEEVGSGDGQVSVQGSTREVWVIQTDEAAIIARDTYELVEQIGPSRVTQD